MQRSNLFIVNFHKKDLGCSRLLHASHSLRSTAQRSADLVFVPAVNLSVYCKLVRQDPKCCVRDSTAAID